MSIRVDCPELRQAYAQNPWPSNEEVDSLATKLGLLERQIKGWYGRCRARDGKPARDPSKTPPTRTSTSRPVASSSSSSSSAQPPAEAPQSEPAGRPRRTRQTTAPSKTRYDPYSASSTSSSTTPRSTRRAVTQARAQGTPIGRPDSDQSLQPLATPGLEVGRPQLSSTAAAPYDGNSRPTSAPQQQQPQPGCSACELPEPSHQLQRGPSLTEPSRYALQSEQTSASSSSSSASVSHDMQALRAPFPDLNSTSGSSDYSFTIDAALNASLRSQTPMHHDQSVDEPMNQAFGEMGFNSTNVNNTNVRVNSDPRSGSQHALGLGQPPQAAAPDRPASSSSVSRTASTSSFNPASQDPFYAGVLPPQINFPPQASTPNIDPLMTVRNAQLVNHARQQAAQFRPHPPTVQPQYARATDFGPSVSSAQVRFDPAYTVPPSFPGFDYSSGPACSAAPFMPPNNAHNNNTNSSEEEWAWSARPSDQGATHLFPDNNNRNLRYNNSSGSGSHFNNIFCNSNAYDTSYGPQQPQPQPPQGQSFLDPATVAMTQQTFEHISPLIPPGFW